MKGEGDLHYAAFDLLRLDGRDLRGKPLSQRKRRLERLIPEGRPGVTRVLTVPEQGRALFEAVQRLDLGIVAKRNADPYAVGVTWVKIKNSVYSHMEGRGELFHPASAGTEPPAAEGEHHKLHLAERVASDAESSRTPPTGPAA